MSGYSGIAVVAKHSWKCSKMFACIVCFIEWCIEWLNYNWTELMKISWKEFFIIYKVSCRAKRFPAFWTWMSSELAICMLQHAQYWTCCRRSSLILLQFEKDPNWIFHTHSHLLNQRTWTYKSCLRILKNKFSIFLICWIQ